MAGFATTVKELYEPWKKAEQFFTGGCVHLSTSGLLACSCGEEIKIVDGQSGSVQFSLQGDGSEVTALCFSAKADRVYSASRSLQLSCWSVAGGSKIRSWKTPKAPVMDLAVDASGGLLAAGAADGSARVWDTDGFFCTHAFTGHSGLVLKVLFHSQQLWLVTAGDDGQVLVWDLVAKSRAATLKGHFSAVTAVDLTPDGWGLLSASRDRTAMLWDLRTHVCLTTIPLYEAIEGAVVLPPDLHFPGGPKPSADSRILKKRQLVFATAGEAGRVRLWRADTGACILPAAHSDAQNSTKADRAAGGIVAAPAGSEFTHLGYDAHKQEIMTCSGDCRILFHNVQAGQQQGVEPPVAATQLPIKRQLIGNLDEVTDVRLVGMQSANMASHVAVATNSPDILLFDLGTMSCSQILKGHSDIVLALDCLAAPMASGQVLLASGGKDAQVRIWDLQDGSCLAASRGHAGSVTALAFARHKPGAFLVSGGADKLLKVWSTAELLGLESAGKKKGKRPQGKAKLSVLSAVAAHDKEINALAISPNDSLLCSASQDRTARIWQLPNLVAGVVLRGHRRGVWAAQFAPREKSIVTSSGDKTLKLWSVADGSCLRTFEGHTASALRVAFLSGGTQLISSGADGLLKLWSLRTSECLDTFDSHEGKVWALDTGGQNDRLLASGAADGALVIWEDRTAARQAQQAEQAALNVENQQALSNALRADDFAEAARLAFQLNQPGRLLSVITTATDRGSGQCSSILQQLVAAWTPEQLTLALKHIAQWNTNARHCHAAHALLHAILMQHPVESLSKVSDVSDVAGALMAYTQRHMSRLDRLLRSSFLLDYTLDRLNVLSPLEDEAMAPAPATPDLSETVLSLEAVATAQQAPAHTAADADAAPLEDAATVPDRQPLAVEPEAVSPSTPAPEMQPEGGQQSVHQHAASNAEVARKVLTTSKKTKRKSLAQNGGLLSERKSKQPHKRKISV